MQKPCLSVSMTAEIYSTMPIYFYGMLTVFPTYLPLHIYFIYVCTNL